MRSGFLTFLVPPRTESGKVGHREKAAMGGRFRSLDPFDRERPNPRGLRLVGADQSQRGSELEGRLAGARRARPSPSLDARRAIAKSNLEAASDRSLDPRDPRWLVAIETAAQLEGSVLTFERRRKVLAFAHRLGVRPFDANLIVAAIQDRARRGESISEAAPIVAMTARPHGRKLGWRKVAWSVAWVVAIGAHAAVATWILR